MTFISLSPEENQNNLFEQDVLSVFQQPDNKKEIRQGMSPHEIAEITSDHLIMIIRSQFEAVKVRFQAQSNG